MTTYDLGEFRLPTSETTINVDGLLMPASEALLMSCSETLARAGELLKASRESLLGHVVVPSPINRVTQLEDELAEARRINSEISVQETDTIRGMAKELDELRDIAARRTEELEKSEEEVVRLEENVSLEENERFRLSGLLAAERDTVARLSADLEETKETNAGLVTANVSLQDQAKSLRASLKRAEDELQAQKKTAASMISLAETRSA